MTSQILENLKADYGRTHDLVAPTWDDVDGATLFAVEVGKSALKTHAEWKKLHKDCRCDVCTCVIGPASSCSCSVDIDAQNKDRILDRRTYV